MRHFILIALVAAATGAWVQDTPAQTGPAAQPQPAELQPVFTPLTTPWTFPDHDAVNAGTVTIITAPAGGAKSVFAADMARVLDEKDKLRILPVLGKGPVQNVIDVLYLKSIDMGLVATDVPEFYKIQYGSNITERLRYIMKLYNDEIHIIAPSEIKTVFDLEGKRIEAPKDVGLYSAKAIFSRLKINVTYDSSHLNDDTGALQEVIDGKADAWIVGTAKVMPIARNIKNENSTAAPGLDPVRPEASGSVPSVGVHQRRIPKLGRSRREVRNRRRRHSPGSIQLARKIRALPKGRAVH